MILDVPFYENNQDGKQCMQVAMQCAIKYFLDKEVSLEELDLLTHRGPGKWTNTSQIVSVLYDLGLNVKFYSNDDIKNILEGEPYFRRVLGNSADKVLKLIDVPVVVNAVKQLLKYNIFEKKAITINELEEYLKNGNLPLIMVDYMKIAEKKGLFQGHFFPLTGYDEKFFYYNEPGPKDPMKNTKVKKEVLAKAISANGTDNDCVIVYGKRK